MPATASKIDWRGDYGFLQVDSTGVYNEDYFAKYLGYAASDMGKALNKVRVDLLRTFSEPGASLVDVGIGCGQFVESVRGAKGYDVNPVGVQWLVDRGLFLDPYRNLVDVLAFWDSFEHIEDPSIILRSARKTVFMAIPIFRGLAHVLSSKHYRPDEHWHYFTQVGLERYMHSAGFRLLYSGRPEEALGREDIGTFVFAREV